MSIFYKAERIGLKGKPFLLWKFRTMVEGGIGSSSTAADDPRLTKVGKFLRRYKLDEIPQLWNVLRGEMSLVGPRPTLAKVINTLSDYEKNAILSIKPGMTGWGTLWNSHEEERLAGSPDPHKKFMEEIYPELVKRELWYVQHKTFWLDLRILITTLCRIIKK